VVERVTGTVVAGLLTVLALAGCNATTLEDSSVEKLIAGHLAGHGHPGATVDCPEVANEIGRRFECSISGAPGITTIEARVARRERIALGRLR
jgi:hypothetical protein